MGKDAEAAIMLVLPSLGAGGCERIVAYLAEHWSAAGRQIIIVSFDAPSYVPYYKLPEAVTQVRLDLPARARPLVRALQRTGERVGALRRTLHIHRPDVVISFLTKMNVMMLQAARGTGIPVIVSERNNPYLQSFGPLWSWARARTYPQAYSLTAMTRGAAAYYPEKQRPRTRIIPNPVSLPPGCTPRGEDLELAAVGRLVRQKRFDRLLDAFALIANDVPGWRLVIWGEGPERAALEAQRDALGLRGRVSLPGISREPCGWLRTAEAFVLSSEYEGWGNVLAEAMSAGLPVVSFDCDFGPSEMITHGHDGLLVENGSVPALAGALRDLLTDPARRAALGDAASATAQRFRIDEIAAQWDALATEAARVRGRSLPASPQNLAPAR